MRRAPRGHRIPSGTRASVRAGAAAAVLLLLIACQSRFESFSFITADGTSIEIFEKPGQRPAAEEQFQPTSANPSSPIYSLRRTVPIQQDGLAFAISYTSSIPECTLILYSDSRTVLRKASLPASSGTRLRFLVPLHRGDRIWGYRLSASAADPGGVESLQLLGAGTSAFVHGFAVEEGDLAVDGSVGVLESSPAGVQARLTSATRQDLSRGWWLISLEPGAVETDHAGRVDLVSADGARTGFTVDAGFLAGSHRIDFARGSVPFTPRDVQTSFPIRSLRLAFLPSDAPIPADPGTILTWDRSQWRRPEFELFSWDRYPGVLIFDTASYDVQDDLFNRLAFFVEKAGHVGAIPSPASLAGLHGYNAHDYRAPDLARFFSVVKESGVQLTAGETRLRDILVNAGEIVSSGSGYAAGTGSVLSISRESSPILRFLLLTHESFHGILFSLPEFQHDVEQIWNDLSPVEQEVWRAFLASRGYDATDHYLVVNEFQAYLFQQDRAAVPGFQALTLSRLRATSPRAASLVQELLAQHPDSFLRSFDSLDAALTSLGGPSGGKSLEILRE